MVIRYSAESDDPRFALGASVEVSGDPDRAVMRGQILRVDRRSEPVELAIELFDGQAGAERFQNWVLARGEVALRLADTLPPAPGPEPGSWC